MSTKQTLRILNYDESGDADSGCRGDIVPSNLLARTDMLLRPTKRNKRCQKLIIIRARGV